jgi:hypothetical protein
MYSQAEKRVKLMDKVIAEWKTKADNISLELNNSQKDTRNASAELFRVKNGYGEHYLSFNAEIAGKKQNFDKLSGRTFFMYLLVCSHESLKFFQNNIGSMY